MHSAISKCSNCEFVASDFVDLNNHMKKCKKNNGKGKSPSQSFYCLHCKFSAKSSRSLANHVSSKHPKSKESSNDLLQNKDEDIENNFSTSKIEEGSPMPSKQVSKETSEFRCSKCFTFVTSKLKELAVHFVKCPGTFGLSNKESEVQPDQLLKASVEAKKEENIKEDSCNSAKMPRAESGLLLNDAKISPRSSVAELNCSNCNSFKTTKILLLSAHYKICNQVKDDQFLPESQPPKNEKVMKESKNETENKPEEKVSSEISASHPPPSESAVRQVQCCNCSFMTTKLRDLAVHYITCTSGQKKN
jgi:hypothetical protein